MKILHHIKNLFSFRKRSTIDKHLRNIHHIEQLIESGTFFIDEERAGVVCTYNYLTYWNNEFVKHKDDRTFHAWMEKCRSYINMKRGFSFGSEGRKLPILQPYEPIYITIVSMDDFSKSCVIGYEIAPNEANRNGVVEFKNVTDELQQPGA